jgi:hypothetical protein
VRDESKAVARLRDKANRVASIAVRAPSRRRILSTFFRQTLSGYSRHYNGQKHAVVGDDPYLPFICGDLEGQSIAIGVATKDKGVIGRAVFSIAYL